MPTHAPRPTGPPLAQALAVTAGIALLAVLAMWPTPGCQFVFDDRPLLVDNPTFAAGDLLGALTGRGQTMANRPVALFVLTLQQRWFGDAAPWFRWVAVLLHLLNVRLLFAVVRSALLAKNLAGRFTATRAFWLAAGVALAFGVHPLGVDVIAYTSQQSMLLMAMCLLSALRWLQRAHEPGGGPRHRRWVVACVALGMACKEEMAPAPLLLLLYDRAFLQPGWGAVRAQWRFHAAVFATWAVLLWCIAAGPPNTTVGWRQDPPVSALEWLQTQAAVVLHYARLSLWPWPLRAVYDTGIEREFARAVWPGLGVLMLLGAAAWLWRRNRPLAWLPALFFLQLAPTSSVLPIVTEVVAERRAYLPMLAVLVPAVLLLDRGIALALGSRHRAAALTRLAVALLLAVPAILAARAHVRVFADDAALWTHAHARNELTNRSVAAATILTGYAVIQNDRGQRDAAFAAFERSMQTEAQTPAVRRNWAQALSERGRLAESEQVLRALVGAHGSDADALGMLADVLYRKAGASGDDRAAAALLAEAEANANRSLQLSRRPQVANTLASVQFRRGRMAEAEATLRQALLWAPDHLQLHRNLGGVLLLAGKPQEAIVWMERLLPALPADTGLRLNLVQGLLQVGDRQRALAVLDEVLRLEPGNATAHSLREQLRTGR